MYKIHETKVYYSVRNKHLIYEYPSKLQNIVSTLSIYCMLTVFNEF